jgi:hypothetical protein
MNARNLRERLGWRSFHGAMVSDLADAFAGEFERLAHFLERVS